MRLKDLELSCPVVAAPMAGVSDKAFRLLAAEYGAALTFTEMISARGLLYGNARTLGMLDLDGEAACGVQLFGADPQEMAAAAAIAVERGAAAVDINMGCPVPKVVKTGAGAALLRDVRRAEAIVRAVAQAVPVPVTVKMRKGWEVDDEAAVDLARAAAAAGAAAVTVHGRAREEFYSGRADWEIIARIKAAVNIPVVGNGDVFSPTDACRMVAVTGCDAVMLARGALGNPWLFSACRAALDGEPLPPAPDAREKLRVAVRHLDLLVAFYGESLGVLRMRKHLVWYVKGLPFAARLREEIFTLRNYEEVRARLFHYACAL